MTTIFLGGTYKHSIVSPASNGSFDTKNALIRQYLVSKIKFNLSIYYIFLQDVPLIDWISEPKGLVSMPVGESTVTVWDNQAFFNDRCRLHLVIFYNKHIKKMN